MTKRVENYQRDDGTSFAVVKLIGDVDLATDLSTRASLRAAFVRAMASERPVIVDCSGMTFLSISGIRALLEAKQRYHRDSPLRLVGPPEGPLARMVDLLGLNGLFHVYPTVTAAL